MHIGVPKEVKTHEYRVGLIPASVRELVHHGHQVDRRNRRRRRHRLRRQRLSSGRRPRSSATAAAVFAAAETDRQGQGAAAAGDGAAAARASSVHLSASRGRPELARALIRADAVAVAYETVTDARGGLPLLAPMSEVAGRMAVQVGAHCLEKEQGGIGVLLGGVPGVPAAKVVILGGGVAGTNAARMAMGMEAYVTVIDRSLPRLYELDLQFGAQLHTLYSTMDNIEREVVAADLVIGAVLVPGAAAPKLVGRDLVRADAARHRHRRHRDRPGRLLSRPADRRRTPPRPMSRKVSCIIA